MQQANENPEPGGNIALDGQGRLYVADTYNNRIRRIDFAAGMVTTVAGNGTAGLQRRRRPGHRGRPAASRATWRWAPTAACTSPTPTTTASAWSTSPPGSSTPWPATARRGFAGDGGPARAGQPVPAVRHRLRRGRQPVRGRHLQQPHPEDHQMTPTHAHLPAPARRLPALLLSAVAVRAAVGRPRLRSGRMPDPPGPIPCPAPAPRSPGHHLHRGGHRHRRRRRRLLPPLETRLYAPVDMAFGPGGSALVVVDWNNHRIRATGQPTASCASWPAWASWRPRR